MGLNYRDLLKFEESNEIDREEKTQKHHEDNLGFQNDVDKIDISSLV